MHQRTADVQSYVISPTTTPVRQKQTSPRENNQMKWVMQGQPRQEFGAEEAEEMEGHGWRAAQLLASVLFRLVAFHHRFGVFSVAHHVCNILCHRRKDSRQVDDVIAPILANVTFDLRTHGNCN